jgi:hypothetical protein
MPKTILALRRYPTALVMAMAVFILSLLLATNSIGTILNGGGDDQGSGMGGTGKSGIPGDSGFGGTGGPSPFLGDTGLTIDSNTDSIDENDAPVSDNVPDNWPAPWLPREQETAAIPADIAPLIELQRNPPQDPFRNAESLQRAEADALRILDQQDAVPSLYLRQLIELADSVEESNAAPQLEISLQIPVIQAPEPIAMPVVQQPHMDTRSDSLANNDAEQLPEILTETPQQNPRQSTERIQRPELPPFQRLRPAVDRASIVPARPQPMRI